MLGSVHCIQDSSDQRCRHTTTAQILRIGTYHALRFDDCNLSRRSGVLGICFNDALRGLRIIYLAKKESNLLSASDIHPTYCHFGSMGTGDCSQLQFGRVF